MADEKEKRRLLGLEDGKPLPTFGKRKSRTPVVEDENRERDLEDFRDEARSLLQKGRERADSELEEAKAAGRKASILNLIRRKQDEEEAELTDDLSEEEEWHRRMSSATGPADRED